MTDDPTRIAAALDKLNANFSQLREFAGLSAQSTHELERRIHELELARAEDRVRAEVTADMHVRFEAVRDRVTALEHAMATRTNWSAAAETNAKTTSERIGTLEQVLQRGQGARWALSVAGALLGAAGTILAILARLGG